MIKADESKEKICMFYASDYHFEMISLPYINKNLKENNNVLVLTENDLNSTIDKLLSMLNLNEEEKNKISKVNWNNNKEEKYKEIELINKNKKETVIFIKGKEKYINDTKKYVADNIDISEIKVVDCYDVNEIKDKAIDISKEYDKILSTAGIEEL